MPPEPSITTTNLFAEATEVLERGEYRRIERPDLQWPTANVRLFEDPYSIVVLLVYETWTELLETWTDGQGKLADLISEAVSKGEAKAWEGYLVVLTPASAAQESAVVDRIRYDVSRVRKLVGTAEDFHQLDDVRRILLPLLPLESELSEVEPPSAIEMVPGLLAAKGTPEALGHALVDAFVRQAPLVEALHIARMETR